MKKCTLPLLFWLPPILLQAQVSKQLGALPRWYVGTDAYVRQENFIVEDPGGQVADSDWMWNFSYGFNLGYRPTQWLAIETGVYRFTYADRINYRFRLVQASHSTPNFLWVSPLRFYIDPFTAGNIKFSSKLKIQLLGGVSWGQHNRDRIIGSWITRGSGVSVLNLDTPNEVRQSHRYSTQLLSRHSINVESGVNVLYRVNERVLASATYGYTFGLNPMVRTEISYQLNTPNGPTYEATQSSKGSGQTLMIGLKYGFGK
jgi:hypothetical protein